MSVIQAILEAEAGETLELGRWRLQWVKEKKKKKKKNPKAVVRKFGISH